MKKAKSIVASLELFDQLSIIIDHRPTTTQENAENSGRVNFIYLAVHKMTFRKETSRFEVFMEHFPRSVESAVTTVSTKRDIKRSCILSVVCL